MPLDPKHKYYFELYYHLGIDRSVAKLAKIQMPRMFPELPPDSREYKTKFNSLYTKMKRWEEREGWPEEAKKREESNRREADVLLREQEQTLTSTVELYSRMVSYLLQKFAEKITQDQVQIRNLKEVLQGRPRGIGAKVFELMNQDERRQSDAVFEWLRKKIQSEPLLAGLRDIVDAEVVVEAGRVLPAPAHTRAGAGVENLPEKEERVPPFLRPLDIPRPEDMKAAEGLEGEQESKGEGR
jgi:hypothetical protein